MNEIEAREMLRAAAGTIDVPPGREVFSERSRWPQWMVPVVAAAAVVLAVGAGVMLADGDQQPAPAGSDFLASYVGWNESDARRDLEKKGYRVDVKRVTRTCVSSNRVLRATTEGDRITLAVTAIGLRPSCPEPSGTDKLALELLDLAAGNGSDIGFDRTIDVVINGSFRTLSQEEAELPRTWAGPTSALSVFRSALAKYTADGSIWNSTFGPIREACGVEHGLRRYASYQSFRTIIRSRSGEPGCAAIDVIVDLIDGLENTAADGYGIAAIVVRTSTASTGSTVQVPDLRGLSADVALPRLESLGLVADTVFAAEAGCPPPRVVRIQQPEQGTSVEVGSTVLLTLSAQRGDCAVVGTVDATARDLAQRFLDFARRTPSVDDIPTDVAVNLYLGGVRKRTITTAESTDPASYVVCTEGYAEAICPFSAIETLRRAGDRVVVAGAAMPNKACAGGQALPASTGRSVFLNASGIDSCLQGFSVQLVFNGVGQITDVNLLLGSP